MPPGYKKISGAWKQIFNIYNKIAGNWKLLIRGYKKVSGAWKIIHLPVPDNIIGFFSAVPASPWDVLNGVDASPDLIGYYLRGKDSEGIANGNNVHSHGSQGFTIALNTGPQYTHIEETDFTVVHTHPSGGGTGESHGHGSTNHEPPYYEMIPATAIGAKTLPVNTLLFYDGAVAPTGWTAWATVYDKFIKCAAAGGGTGGLLGHSHSYTGNTIGYGDSRDFAEIGIGAYVLDKYQGHIHSVNHTHTGGQNFPIWTGLLPVRNDIEVNYIPSGIVAFFTGSTVPFGWTLRTDLEDKFIQCLAAGTGSGGANSHTHSHGNTGNFTGDNSTNKIQTSPSTDQNPSYNPHYQTHNGNHTSVSNIISHIPLLICEKD